MSGKTYRGGINSTTVTWEVEETEATQDEVAFVNIKCVGWLSSDMSLGHALGLVPSFMPSGEDGPCGSDTELANAELQRRTAKFEDSMIRVDCTYKKAVAIVVQGPNGTPQESSSSADKTALRIAISDEPILSHPIVSLFNDKQKSILSALIQGSVKSNFEVEDGTPQSKFPFVRYNPDTQKWDVEVVFDSGEVTLDGVTASPRQFAAMIRAGIITYRRPAVTFTVETSRRTPTGITELDSVGTIVKPALAPTVPDRQWFYDGINEEQITEDMYRQLREYSLTEKGGGLKTLYKGGDLVIDITTGDYES